MGSFHAVVIGGLIEWIVCLQLSFFCCWVVTISHCKSACQGIKIFFRGYFLLLFKSKEIISKAQIKLDCQQEGDEVD